MCGWRGEGCQEAICTFIHPSPIRQINAQEAPWPGAHFVGSHPRCAIPCLVTLDKLPGLSVAPVPQHEMGRTPRAASKGCHEE